MMKKRFTIFVECSKISLSKGKRPNDIKNAHHFPPYHILFRKQLTVLIAF